MPVAPSPRALPRRTMIAASGTAVLAVAAACSSGNSGSAATTSTSTASSSTATTPSAASSPSNATTSAAASALAEAATPDTTTTAEAAPTGTPLASVADVQSAGSVVVQAASGPVLLAYSNGTVVAHTAICTHQQCTIAASGSCPCHGSKFDVTTGAVENGPALKPLAEESVMISGGQVYSA